MIGVRLQPVDTWFFRDGTSFAMDSTPQENVGSLFPPHSRAGVDGLLLARFLADSEEQESGR